MARHEHYRQCVLRRVRESGAITQTTTYLPSKGLKVGRLVRFKNRGGEEWSPWWRIERMGELKEGEYVEERETDYQRTRQASDV